jgi:hypothetical protein
LLRFGVTFSGSVLFLISKTLAQVIYKMQVLSFKLLKLWTLRGRFYLKGYDLKIRVSSVRSRPLPPPFNPNKTACLLGFLHFWRVRLCGAVDLVAPCCVWLLVENS